MKDNTIKELFDTKYTGKKDFLEYYELSERNLYGKFMIQRSIAKQFDLTVRDNRLRILSGIGQKIFDSFIKRSKLLRTIGWKLFEPDTIETIRDAIVEGTFKLITNNGAIETVKSSSVQGGSFQFSQDIDSYILNFYVPGRFASNLYDISGLKDYEIIGESEIFTNTKNGNYKLIKSLKDIDLIEGKV